VVSICLLKILGILFCFMVAVAMHFITLQRFLEINVFFMAGALNKLFNHRKVHQLKKKNNLSQIHNLLSFVSRILLLLVKFHSLSQSHHFFFQA
jgi:cobalamin biosynthesis protein CobD/CbiB